MKIAVVIPCYNEEVTIRDVILDYLQYFDDIYIVDNNCTDNTVSIAEEYGVHIITESIQGKGASLRRAFSIIDADIIVLTDGDSTYFAKDSKKLVEYLVLNNLDMVIGNRLSSGYFKKNQIFHGIGNNIFCKYASNKYKLSILDLLSGSRVLSKNLYKNIYILHNGFEVETELTKKCISFNRKLGFVDINYVARPKNSKSSIHAIKDGLKILLSI